MYKTIELSVDDVILFVVEEECDSTEENHKNNLTRNRIQEFYEMTFLPSETNQHHITTDDYSITSEDIQFKTNVKDNESDNNISEDDEGNEDTEYFESKSGVQHKEPEQYLFKSKVAELQDADPSLKTNEAALIHQLVNVMMSVETPPLDQDHDTNCEDGYRCNFCSKVNSSKGASDRHYLEKHGPRYLLCFACGDDFRCATNLYKHEKRCKAPDAYIVLQARAMCVGKKARGKSTVTLSKSQNTNSFKCSMCSASFKLKSSLMNHEMFHRAEAPYQCHICERAYTAKSVLTRHLLTHKEAAFICNHCGRACVNKSALKSHMFSHSEPRFPCEECPQRFTYKTALALHVRRKHRNLPLPLACQVCPRRFGRVWTLKDHMKKAHDLVLITRRMLRKQLPNLTDDAISQAQFVQK